MKRIIVLFLLIGYLIPLKAQEAIFVPHFGASIGLAFNFGTQVNRLGFQASGYYAHEHVQAFSSLRFYYNFTSYGPKTPRPEWQLSLGALASYGHPDSLSSPFIQSISNQTGHKNSLGYTYNWYFEKLTRQPTGTLALQFGRWEILTENDALAGQGKDRFRTGAIEVAYVYQDSRYALQSILWTGNTHGEHAKRVKEAGDYPCRYGYKDISQTHCGRYSHGILAFQYRHHLGYAQSASASLGIDSERIRHFLQNQVIHDMPFWPEKWNKVHNPHLPMLDKNGVPFLFEEGQELKPLRFFFEVGGNESLFY